MTHTNLAAFQIRILFHQVFAAIQPPPAMTKGSLSQAELRRIVADMID